MNWIARVFNDNGFSIIPNSGGGDCFYYVMEQATSLPAHSLKRLVSNQVTLEEFEIKQSLVQSAKVNYAKTGKLEYLNDIVHYGWVSRIPNLTQYKKMLEKPGVWSDGETIARMEQILQCRILLLCRKRKGFIYPTISTVTNPKFYVIVHYIGSLHFELVTYEGNKFFSSSDLPHAIKCLISQEN